MKFSIILFAFAATAYARWASLTRPVGLPSNCPQGACASPILDEGKWRKKCDKLVKNGCATSFVVGIGGLGSTAFVKRKGVSCDDARPSSVDECFDTIRAAYSAPGGTNPGTCVSATAVLDDGGRDLGHIGVTGACLRAPRRLS